jgi:hypothetical protein
LSGPYRLRWFEDGDLEAYISGLNENLYDLYDERRFRWKFLHNPSSLGFVSIAVAEAPDGEPVAFNSFLPLRVRVGGEDFTVVEGCDGFVFRGHRRAGLFQETLRFMARELRGRGPEFLMGFNFAGSEGAARKAGSAVGCDVLRWRAKPEEISKQKLGIGDMSVKPAGVDKVQALYEEWASSNSKLHVHRSPEYLSWRFYGSPRRSFELFAIEAGGEEGYVAVSTDTDDQGSLELSIDDYTPMISRVPVASAVLGHILRLYPDLSEVSALTPSGSALGVTLSGLGFSPDPDVSYSMIIKAIEGLEAKGNKLYRKGLELTDIGNWYITGSDVF